MPEKQAWAPAQVLPAPQKIPQIFHLALSNTQAAKFPW